MELMNIPTHETGSISIFYEYVKANLSPCKVTFRDGSVY